MVKLFDGFLKLVMFGLYIYIEKVMNKRYIDKRIWRILKERRKKKDS